MGIDYLKSYGDLQQELEDAKSTLFTLNDNIRRIVGKDVRATKHKTNADQKRNEPERQGKSADLQKYKKRGHDSKTSVFNRLSAQVRPSEEEVKPRLNSRVIRELPTRQEIVEAQGTDSESRARNRRMFGSLLGTLHKFCQEETRLKDKEQKKAQIEKKLEAQEIQERETLKKERESLFLDRKRKQMEIKNLEIKMNRLKDFEIWESSMQHLKQSIKTKTKPHILFKPKIMTKKTDKLLLEHQASVDSLISKKRAGLQKELAELESSLKLHDADPDECMGHNESFCRDEESNKAPGIDIMPKKKRARIDSPKGASDSKENKNRHSNEPALCSSIVVVKTKTSDDKKIN